MKLLKTFIYLAIIAIVVYGIYEYINPDESQEKANQEDGGGDPNGTSDDHSSDHQEDGRDSSQSSDPNGTSDDHSGDPSEYKFLPNIQYMAGIGNTNVNTPLSLFRSDSLGECGEKCDSDDNCVGFTVNPRSKFCNYFSEMVDPIQTTDYFSYVKK